MNTALRRPLAASLLLFLAPAIALAESADDFVEGYLKQKQIPGSAIMVRHEGKTVLCQGYGAANLEHDVRVKPQTIFQSGSIGKQFTAMAVMLLVEDGKIALADPVTKYLDLPASWSGMTVRHLLTHTSGLGDYREDFSLQADYTEEDLLKMIKAQPLASAPGEKWSYSNLGYVSLGILIHKASGEFYGDFLQRRVFAPLGMKSAQVINEADIIPHRAAGYRLKEGALKNQEWISPSVNTTADGSLYLTADDMAKWAEGLDNEKLLSRAGYEQMWAPVKLNDGSTAPYGFGWGIHQTPAGRRVLEHGGVWQGFAAHIARYPNDHLTVAVFCNRVGASARYIAQRVAGSYVPALAPPVHTAKKIDPAILRSYAGDYRLEERFSIKVKAVGGHLETTWLGEKMIMTPKSESAFFEEDSDRTFRFEKDDKGAVTSLIISVPEELVLRRLP
ncbi:MAG: serine hydrolase [Chthoniobacterales bacterium]|nr:serine hydrolase [Chthoniobacterales bacterium]